MLKRQANNNSLRLAETIAEERIAKFKLSPETKNSYQFGRKDNTFFVHKARVLNLKNLGLKTVPESLRTIRNLTLLDLEGNKIQGLPSWIGELSSLEVINLSSNQLQELPPEIGSLNNLIVLLLEENQLHSLPETLLALCLRIREKKNPFFYLSLSGNPNLGLPDSIIKSHPVEILRYYFESRNEKGRPLLELKLLLVGRGKAGKTTLVKQLAGEKPDENESETHSIAIRELTIGCPHGRVRTRAWDFGGQEILHSTHQFFLTERSLYLLVLEPRSGLAQRDAEYWLKLIETQGGKSPVIVVLNWSHGRHWQVDKVKLRRKFPFIVDFMPTAALHDEGIEEMRRTIQKTVDGMKDVWLPFPERWRMIKDAVAGMHDNFLTYGQFTELCEKFGENDPLAQADLAGILHALGLALYFGKDPLLHDTRVLNPGWVTGGVYAVIRAPYVALNDGQLSVRDMPRVLHEAEEQKVIRASDYPVETHRFILELMRAFQLCYASEDWKEKQVERFRDEEDPKPVRYLVPDLLPEFEPEMKEDWEKAPVHLRYSYEVLLPGLLPRFIVRTHTLSDGAPHWRHGVVLRHAEAKVLIRAESDRQELHVFVLDGDSETRRMLVAMVRRELETLHSDMKIQPVEELELTGEGEQWISVRALREVEQPEKPTQKLPIQPDGTAEVNVPHELDKLEPAEARAIDRNPSIAPVPVRVFVSYAHDDERQLKRLDLILDVLEQQYCLASWRDRRLIAGDEWDEEIRRRMEEMDIFLFIASQTSLVRPYIKEPELRRAKERHKAGEVEIVSVKLEPCACDEDPFLGKLHRLAPRFKSIVETSPRSKAWEQVRKDLLPVIQRVRDKKKKAAKLARDRLPQKGLKL